MTNHKDTMDTKERLFQLVNKESRNTFVFFVSSWFNLREGQS
jgi:hypothetical protein